MLKNWKDEQIGIEKEISIDKYIKKIKIFNKEVTLCQNI